jgi:HNH endonuclease
VPLLPRYISRQHRVETQQSVWQRDGGRCHVCGKKTKSWQVHHDPPVVYGGGCAPIGNLQTLCRECHRKETSELATRRAKQRAFMPTNDRREADDHQRETTKRNAKRNGETKMATFDDLEKSGGNFVDCPEGRFAATLVDVVDEGWRETFHQGQSTGFAPHIKFVWETGPFEFDESTDPPELAEMNGKTFLVFDRRMRMSTHENATLRKTLEAWLTAKGLAEFRGKEMREVMESLIGRPACIQVIHAPNPKNDKRPYVNVATVLPYRGERRDGPLLEKTEYTRRHLRDDWATKRPAVSSYTERDEALDQLDHPGPEYPTAAPQQAIAPPGQPLPPTNRTPEPIAPADYKPKGQSNDLPGTQQKKAAQRLARGEDLPPMTAANPAAEAAKGAAAMPGDEDDDGNTPFEDE